MDGFKNTTRMKVMGKQDGGRVSAPIVPVTRRSDTPNVSVGGVGGGYGPSYSGATGSAMRAGDMASRLAPGMTAGLARGPARGVGLNVRIPLKKGGEAKAAACGGPMKKAMGGACYNEGGAAKKRPSAGAAVASGNRMSKMDAEDLAAVTRTTKPASGAATESEMRRVRRKVETKAPAGNRMPSPGESVASGNRMSRMDTDDLAAVMRTTPRAKGGAMKKAMGGLAVMPKGGKGGKDKC